LHSHRPENEAEHRFAVIKPLASRFRNSATSIEEAAKLLSISPRQVYRLIEVCRSSPYLDAFERQSNSPKGASNSRLPVVVENIISKCIEAVFDGREEKQSADDVYAQVFTKCVEVGEQPSSEVGKWRPWQIRQINFAGSCRAGPLKRVSPIEVEGGEVAWSEKLDRAFRFIHERGGGPALCINGSRNYTCHTRAV